jgi:hypothetical protein
MLHAWVARTNQETAVLDPDCTSLIAHMYPVRPFGNKPFGVIFMNARSCQLNKVKWDGNENICSLFWPIIRTAEYGTSTKFF